MREQADGLDAVFPVAAAIALELIQRPEVADGWLRPSALLVRLAVHRHGQPAVVSALTRSGRGGVIAAF